MLKISPIFPKHTQNLTHQKILRNVRSGCSLRRNSISSSPNLPRLSPKDVLNHLLCILHCIFSRNAIATLYAMSNQFFNWFVERILWEFSVPEIRLSVGFDCTSHYLDYFHAKRFDFQAHCLSNEFKGALYCRIKTCVVLCREIFRLRFAKLTHVGYIQVPSDRGSIDDGTPTFQK